MKKLVAAAICTIISTLHILGMETNTLQIPEHFPYECSKHILLEYAQNVHRYVREKHGYRSNREPSGIIFNVSLVNKDLYKQLDKERNDPITARTIITNLKNTCPDWNCLTVEKLRFPGAKKCIALSEQLYDENLTIEKLEQLFSKGAILDFSVTKKPFDSSQYKEKPLIHWYQEVGGNSYAITKKLLELGADPNQCGFLELLIKEGESQELITITLKYTARINHYTWDAALSKDYPTYRDLLINHSTPDELNAGLVCCAINKYNSLRSTYSQETMQQLIDNGANPNIALYHLMVTLKDKPCPLNDDNNFVKNFNFLCKQKAFDQTTLNSMRNLQKLFGDLADTLEKNQPEKELK